MSNLINMGSQLEQDALGYIDQTSAMETQRNNMNRQLDQAYDAQKSSNMATGAGLGWMAATGGTKLGAAAGAKFGTAAAGPIGAIAGAAIGFLATRLF